jgi:hypothetical protein
MVLPVARTGPLRVAAEAVSAPVEAVPQDLFRTALKHCYNVMGPKTPPCCDGCRYEWAEALKTIREALGIKEGEYPAPLGATPHQAEPETTCNCRWQGEKLVKQCTLHEAHRDAIHEWARRAKDAEAGLQGYRDTVARLTAELQEVRKDAGRLDYVLEEVSMRALCDAGILDDTRSAIDAAITAAEAPKP